MPEAVGIIAELSAPGRPLEGDELAEFEASPFAADACQVRRWDDEANYPAELPRPFGHFAPILEALLS